MTTEKRKKAALGEFNEYISDYHRFTRDTVETIRELLQPTPQNREADMPDEIYANNFDGDQYWCKQQNAQGIKQLAKYIRADLANKPALDTGWICPNCKVAYNPKKNRCECQDGLKARMG